MLTTNMIRKDLHSQSMYDAGLALSGMFVVNLHADQSIVNLKFSTLSLSV